MHALCVRNTEKCIGQPGSLSAVGRACRCSAILDPAYIEVSAIPGSAKKVDVNVHVRIDINHLQSKFPTGPMSAYLSTTKCLLTQVSAWYAVRPINQLLRALQGQKSCTEITSDKKHEFEIEYLHWTDYAMQIVSVESALVGLSALPQRPVWRGQYSSPSGSWHSYLPALAQQAAVGLALVTAII